ncbi:MULTISPECIES: SRPBCC family protein [unclassified Flavobacterium]|jgi:hypothetical protein|uniref:SRPBCC family protein n=1 Tax=unclassified Flavobacterium TaxID=196869 RepID=UPI00131DACFF|nr:MULTISPECIES: SRPBCC family protein [unclassified Flavobacterium]
MRILKYIFLLLLLSLVALTIFIATQKGDFTVERSHIIKAPKNTVYQFVNDLRNWEDFATWTTEDPTTQLSYSEKSTGNGATMTWESQDNSGSLKNLSSKENDSIFQKMDYKGSDLSIVLRFKDTLNGTKITWKSQGKMSFTMKIMAAMKGGIDKIMGRVYEKSLEKLEKTLVFETNTFNVKVIGLTTKSGTNFLRQTFTSKLPSVYKNALIIFNTITTFCSNNGIELNGKPFLLFHSYNTTTGLAKISFCVPTKNRILTSSGSDILSGNLEPFEAVKTLLTGNYTHINKAIQQSNAYIAKNKIIVNPNFSHLEIFKINKTEVKNASKWETEIYVPLPPKVIPVMVPVKTTTAAATTPIRKLEPPAIEEKEETEF